ncbi:MAG: hypothetical protein JXQ71_03250 [Verrucomicrobia bacterium]|nr:hypothetical protein [Verrucomicrobiota bacterium]
MKPPVDLALRVRSRLPPQGMFANQHWRIAPTPFPLEPRLAHDLDSLGRVLLQFYRAANLLHRQSAEGKQPPWIADWLDRGKPASLLAWQRHRAFRNDLPRVIRPDLLLTAAGLCLVELDSVPGGIGLTAWLNRTYTEEGARQTILSNPANPHGAGPHAEGSPSGAAAEAGGVLGGADGMFHGFESIFGDATRVHLVVSDEAAMYRPEMSWLANQLGPSRFLVQNADFDSLQDGDAVYRFFELFDLPHVPCAETVFARAAQKRIRLTPPPKPLFEEKLLFAFLWNRNLRAFWRQELGEAFFERLQQLVPYSWIVDPTPLPPHAAIPELNLTDWHQLKSLSQRERDLVLKISGYSELAWGARSIALGSDLSLADWSTAVDRALRDAAAAPWVLQRYHKPRTVQAAYVDTATQQLHPMPARARLCPYYFVAGDGPDARARLGGVLATLCPADKKIIHGMKDAILAPCAAAPA